MRPRQTMSNKNKKIRTDRFLFPDQPSPHSVCRSPCTHPTLVVPVPLSTALITAFPHSSLVRMDTQTITRRSEEVETREQREGCMKRCRRAESLTVTKRAAVVGS